jgi:hypothetical protein
MTETTANTKADLLLAARLLELWRLCGKTACRRARDCCGDPRRCCEALAEWSEMLAAKDKTSSFEQCLDELRAE